uniref:WD_REPEATS_REGION domain-containing protein n=1 Tax=Heterorhabditis bacteriophora TaxID=37862 RepID=A0A1I7XUB5_HETBA
MGTVVMPSASKQINLFSSVGNINNRELGRHNFETLPSAVSCMDIDRKENAYLLCGSVTGNIYLSNLYAADLNRKAENITLLDSFQHKYFITDCQWYADDIRLFITASTDKKLKVWDLANVKMIDALNCSDISSHRTTPQIHWNEINRTNPLIAMAVGSTNIQLFDLRVGGIAQELRSRGSSGVCAVRWIPSDLHLLVTGDSNGGLAVWDTRSGRDALSKWNSGHVSAVGGIRFTNDGLYLVSGSTNREVVLWDANTMERINEYQVPGSYRYPETSIRFTTCDEGPNIQVAVPCNTDVTWIQFNRLYSASGDRQILCWASEYERKRVNLETESLRQQAIQDSWSDDDDGNIIVRPYI